MRNRLLPFKRIEEKKTGVFRVPVFLGPLVWPTSFSANIITALILGAAIRNKSLTAAISA
jgi:hypothetical protein